MGTNREGCEGRQRAGGAVEEWVLVTQHETDMGLSRLALPDHKDLHSSILSTNALSIYWAPTLDQALYGEIKNGSGFGKRFAVIWVWEWLDLGDSTINLPSFSVLRIEVRDTTRLAATQLGTSNTFLGIHHPLCRYLFITACMDRVTITFFFSQTYCPWRVRSIRDRGSKYPEVSSVTVGRNTHFTLPFHPSWPHGTASKWLPPGVNKSVRSDLSLFSAQAGFILCLQSVYYCEPSSCAVVMTGYYNQRICLGIFKL